MLRNFNNGIGLIIVAAEKDLQDVVQQIQAMGEITYQIGWIEERGPNSALRFID